jgi:hypothetical protein
VELPLNQELRRGQECTVVCLLLNIDKEVKSYTLRKLRKP